MWRRIARHFSKAGALKGRAADSVVYKVLRVQIAVLLGVIHQNDFLVLNTVALSVQAVVLRKTTVKGGDFLALCQ